MKTRVFVFFLLIVLAVPISVVSARTIVEHTSSTRTVEALGQPISVLPQGKATVTPTPAAAVVPQQGGTGAGEILFQDDFSDPNSGWYTGTDEYGTFAYTNGVYDVTSTKTGSYTWGQPFQNFSNITIDVDITQVLAPATNYNSFGVVCNIQDDYDAYMLRITGDGWAAIQKLVNGEFTPLVDWFETPAIIQGNATNHVQVVCGNGTLELIVNGTSVAQAQDSEYTAGDIALVVASYDEVPNQIQFDNVVVTSASGGTGVVTTPPTTGTSALIFEDDFSDPASGWEVGNYNGGSVGYGTGDYVVTSTLAASTMWGIASQNFTDIDLEVDATQTLAPANNNNGYGVMCRVQADGASGYVLRISGDGYAAIHVNNAGTVTPLSDWATTSAVTQGNATNHLRVVCSGSTFELYVDDTLVASATDTTFTSGDIALAVSSFEAEPSEVHFDNLVVNAPGVGTTTGGITTGLPGISGLGQATPQNNTTTTGQVLYQDDFSDPSTGWEVGNYDGGSVGYANGAYSVIATQQGNIMWGIGNQNFTDIDLEADATQISAAANNNNAYGVICRLQANNDGYLLRISGDGFAAIHANINGSITPLVDWTSVAGVVQGNSTNHIRVVCSGSTLELYVNGTLVASATDSTYASGDISFAVTTFEVDPSEVQFDNLVVNAP